MNRIAPLQSEDISSYQLVPNRFHKEIQRQTCRICLEQQSQDGFLNPMIVACQCSGTVGHVHQKCIKMWIQKQQQQSGTKRAYCQLCKAQIFYKVNKELECECNSQRIYNISACNVICLVVQIIMIGVVGAVRWVISDFSNYLLVHIVTALLAALFLILVLTILLIIKDICLRQNKMIQRIYSRQESYQLGLCDLNLKLKQKKQDTKVSSNIKQLQIMNNRIQLSSQNQQIRHFSQIFPIQRQ